MAASPGSPMSPPPPQQHRGGRRITFAACVLVVSGLVLGWRRDHQLHSPAPSRVRLSEMATAAVLTNDHSTKQSIQRGVRVDRPEGNPRNAATRTAQSRTAEPAGFHEVCHRGLQPTGPISSIDIKGSAVVDTNTPFLSMRGIACKMCDAREDAFVSDSKRGLSTGEFPGIRDGSYVFVTSTRLFRLAPVLRKHKNIVLFTGNAVRGTPIELSSAESHIPRAGWENLLRNNVDVWVAQNLDLRGDKIPADLAHKFIGLPLGLNFHTLRQQINGDFKDAGAMRGKGSTTKEQSDALAGIATASAPFGQRQPMVFLPLMTEFKKRHDNDRGLCKRHFWGGAGHNISVRQDGGLTSRTEHWKEVAKYQFIASPMGMGMDAHRTYEALALGTIPIVRRSPITAMFESTAVMVVDSWTDVTVKSLKEWAQRWPSGPPAQDASLDSWVCKLNHQINRIRAAQGPTASNRTAR